MDTENKRLLSVKDIMRIYGVGRQTAINIVSVIPHIRVAKRRYVFPDDLEAFFKRATESQMDITEYVKEVRARGGIKAPSDKE